MQIEILGPGCAKCKQTERIVKQALQTQGTQADVVHVTDPSTFARYGVMFTPAVVVDGKVVISGKVPSIDEVTGALQQG